MTGAESEVQAIQQVSLALESLNREECRRVLGWAQGRYVDLPDPLEGVSVAGLQTFTKELADIARGMDGVSPLDIMKAAEAFLAAKRDSTPTTKEGGRQ